MAYRESIHVEAPVSKVFNFFSNPNNWRDVEPDQIDFRDVTLTQEGVGTHYRLVRQDLGVACGGVAGVHRVHPEPVENHARSFWRLPLLEVLFDRATAKTHEPRFARLKAILEA